MRQDGRLDPVTSPYERRVGVSLDEDTREHLERLAEGAGLPLATFCRYLLTITAADAAGDIFAETSLIERVVTAFSHNPARPGIPVPERAQKAKQEQAGSVANLPRRRPRELASPGDDAGTPSHPPKRASK